MIRFRYLVEDVDEAVSFYTSHLGFRVEQQFGKAIAILERDGVSLIVSGPMASAGRPMPDGAVPSPPLKQPRNSCKTRIRATMKSWC